MTGHVSSAFPGAQDHRTRSFTGNKSPSESMSFITVVICKFIFTDSPYEKQLPSESGLCQPCLVLPCLDVSIKDCIFEFTSSSACSSFLPAVCTVTNRVL